MAMLDAIYEYDQTNEQIKTYNKIILIITMATLALVPLLVYRHDTTAFTPVFEGNAYATGVKVDVFNYYKTVIFNILTLIILGLFIYKTIVLGDEIKKTKLNIAIMILGGIIAITPLLSKYTDVALFGNYDRYEGAYTWFSYLAIFFILYNTKIEEKYYKYFFIALIPFIAINLTLGVLNTYGINIIENETVNKLLGGGLGGYIVTTLYHPNFGSAISAVIFSTSFMYLLLEEKIVIKIALLLTTVASFVMLITMVSSGGFITIVVMIPVIIVVGLRFTNIKNVALWSLITFILSASVYNILNKVNEKIYNESFALLAKINNISSIILPTVAMAFIIFVIILKFVNRKITFNIITGIMVISIFGAGIFTSLAIEKEKDILANDPNANITRIEDREIYKKLNELSTARIEIWMKTIDMINERPLIGHGFDTYPYVIAELDEDNGKSSLGEFIDKPHNWYINVAYGSGIIALATLLAILVYIIKGVYDNISDKVQNKYLYVFGMGAIAYMVTGIFNDSFIGTASIFWILAGVTTSILMNKKEC